MPKMQVRKVKDFIFLNKINVLLPRVIDLNLQVSFKLQTGSEQSVSPIIENKCTMFAYQIISFAS